MKFLSLLCPGLDPLRDSDRFIPEAFCHITKMNKHTVTGGVGEHVENPVRGTRHNAVKVRDPGFEC